MAFLILVRIILVGTLSPAVKQSTRSECTRGEEYRSRYELYGRPLQSPYMLAAAFNRHTNTHQGTLGTHRNDTVSGVRAPEAENAPNMSFVTNITAIEGIEHQGAR